MEQEIIKGLSELDTALLAKGYAKPHCHFSVRFLSEVACIAVKYLVTEDMKEEKSYFVRGETFAGCMERARELIAGLPNPNEERRKAFMRKVAGLLEAAKEIGMEVDFVNPLETMMKKLSENVLEAPRHED